MKINYTALLLVFLVSGCSSTFDYTAPPGQPGGADSNTTTLSMPRDKVWDAAIPLLGKQFFVINNLDRSSGFINLSYSGNPTDYIDCGTVTVSTPGRAKASFPGATPATEYIAVAPNVGAYQVSRTVSLEGRMNVVLEEVNKDTTRVTTTTRYVVTKSTSSGLFSNSITGSFDTGKSEMIGAGDNAMICQPTGRLEENVIKIFNSID